MTFLWQVLILKVYCSHLRIILDHPDSFGLVIDSAKCVFEASSVEFLRHLFSAKGIQPRSVKVKAIPIRKTTKFTLWAYTKLIAVRYICVWTHHNLLDSK